MFVLKNVKFFVLIEFDFLKIIGTYAISHVASDVETNVEKSETELSREAKKDIENPDIDGIYDVTDVMVNLHMCETCQAAANQYKLRLYQHRQEVQI